MTVKRHYLKASFLVCFAVLLTAAASKALIINSLGVQLTKLPIPMQTPLENFDETTLSPYAVLNKQQITNREILESLGTEEYLQWTLHDTEAATDSPTRYCSLFITYYTGNPDMVPHVPDECYVGGGNKLVGSQTLSVQLPRQGKIGFQSIQFQQNNPNSLQGSVDFTVQYLFHANGQYCQSRTDTRTTLFDWFSRYSYFCKVEWKFFGQDAFGLIYPNREQTQAATVKLLSVLLEELEKNHWPDWETVNRDEDNAAGAES
jgi:hypothetical protein